ncbi:MAG: response regulator transcription factor [Saprospiraceae bacterium]|nr:response regulator transcription factor [Saprospiraceae bacterium]
MAEKILIIEDSQMMREFLSNLFKKRFEVISFENGRDAKKWLEQGNTPQLVIADLQMPEMNGLEFTQFFRANISQTIPLVILTGDKDSNNTIACLQAGANDYILKPFRPKILSIKIEGLLGATNA